MVIAIDGPASSGKGTVARLLSQKLNCTHLDSGVFYRVVAFYVYDQQLDPNDAAPIIALLPRLQVELRDTPSGQRVISRGRDLTDEIRYELVSRVVALVSRISEVRQWVEQTVRQMARGRDVVVEGRDMTTEVFPRAEYKIYLDATLDERARRRYLELKSKGEDVNLAGVKAGIVRRDAIDRSKPKGALRVAPGAIYIDSTKLSPEQVVNFIIDKVNNSQGTGAKTI